jgi:ArsR family transcriptional regulator, arsenate/arsenite/antimonite-responsive transcriptional repressor / arsenate reductase (thioredoxin)
VAQSLTHDVSSPGFLQLAGHPLRWRLLAELAWSDRTVQELTDLVGEPQNLVSYHLAKLREAGLVSARRSSADRRDAYYTADLERIAGLLSATGAALHPGLRLTPPAHADLERRAVRVLFLCTGNSARSQMAEALARARGIEAYSAGSHPKPVHPNATRVMREEHGLDLSGHESKHLKVFDGKRFDWVISLCDRLREVCPEFTGDPQLIHWSIPNPADGDAGDDATHPLFRQTAADLATRIGFLLASIAERAPAPRKRRRRHDRSA